MKSNYLTHVAVGALLFASALAAAQSADPPKGNEVTGNPQPPPAKALSTPQTVGQDASAGNNLVGSNTGQATAMHPDFATLDVKQRGYLTKHDVKTHKWLSKNFAKCDADHDGHLSQDEYAACHK